MIGPVFFFFWQLFVMNTNVVFFCVCVAVCWNVIVVSLAHKQNIQINTLKWNKTKMWFSSLFDMPMGNGHFNSLIIKSLNHMLACELFIKCSIVRLCQSSPTTMTKNHITSEKCFLEISSPHDLWLEMYMFQDSICVTPPSNAVQQLKIKTTNNFYAKNCSEQ